MFEHLDVTDAVVLLCGSPERTSRVLHKYGAAASVIQCANPADLQRAASLRPSLVVICAGESVRAAHESALEADGVVAWRAAVRQAVPGVVVSVDTEQPKGETGTVFLIGAGPGDPGLMTARAFEALSASDVVLIDHLAPTADIAAWAPGAEIIDVGKVPGQHKVPQREIDRLMIDHALAGRNVARVKGGDPYVFGRGTEELYVCERAGLKVEVVSGVTASISVPARAKVPMTLRKVSHMFTVVSGHAELSDAELDHLAGFLKSGGTISLLMGVRTLPHTVAGLLARGVRGDMPLGTFEDVYRANERVRYSTLARANEDLQDVRPPAITVIGEVVAAGDSEDAAAQVARDELLGLALSEGKDARV
ncbi:uroporphyrinogen-III C-methyltransferase [Rothia sp. LK2588]|uniref:uroporphyrinogen-III C-methyltransferase n=1 Tax=Rothia sp. LK2588 TaxID=3114369 RepID=UPI0034CD7A2E